MKEVQERAQELFEELVEIRRDFHMHPEVSSKEYRTAEKIEAYLDAWGIENTRVADTGVVGIIRGKKNGTGKVIGMRADIDALPIHEAEDREYRSVNDGVMHACGHDMHATILLGAAKILKEREDEFAGAVKLFFQPAEEAVGGAKRMIAAGCLENPEVDHVIGLHVQASIPTGNIEMKYGTLTAITDKLLMTVKGKAGHAAVPDLAVDSIAVAAQIVTSLQMIVSRIVSPHDTAVLTIGKIAGGSQANIIAGEVEMEGTVRTFSWETRTKIEESIREISTQIATAFGATVDMELREGYIGVVNDVAVTDVIKDVAVKLLGEEKVQFKEFASMGGEDFAYFAEAVPSSFYHLGCRNEAKGITASAHNKFFDADEDCIPVGVVLQVESAFALLES